MTFRPLSTNDKSVTDVTKTLLYSHHGFGKTTQLKHYQRAYGKGFVISGESGLQSVSDVGIAYLPFQSWDGDIDPANNIYSFKSIVGFVRSPDFKAEGYKWIGIDSITEVSERCLEHFQREHAGSKDGFKLWQDYEASFVGAMKWLRDLPIHVYMSALALEEEDDNGVTNYWPMVKMKKIQKHLPALLDNVFCGVRRTADDGKGGMRVERYLVTDEVKGWHGKARDPKKRLVPVERTSNVVELLQRIAMPDSDYEGWLKQMREIAPAAPAAA